VRYDIYIYICVYIYIYVIRLQRDKCLGVLKKAVYGHVWEGGRRAVTRRAPRILRRGGG
jgi:hypothetical protein